MRSTTRACRISALLLVASAASAEPALHGTLVRPGVVAIRGDGFASHARLDVLVDPAWPHASIACHAARTRTVHADAHGRFAIVLAPRGECRFDRDRYRAYADRDGTELAASRAFD